MLIATLLLYSIASGLSAFAATFAIFSVFRFFTGVGLGGELPVASTLVAENTPTNMRGRAVVLLESFWAGGWILSALVSYFVIPLYGWQSALLIGAIPAFYAVYLRYRLPDSPRAERGKGKKHVMESLAMLWSKPYARATLTLWLLWFCINFSYYGIFLWMPTVMVAKGFTLIKSFQYVLIMTLAQLPGYFSAAWLIEKRGRKFVLSIYLLGTAISSYFFGTATTLPLLLTAGLFLSFFNLGAWGALYAYTPEQYPASIRSTGSGAAATIGRIGAILGPLMIGYLQAAHTSFGVIFSIFFTITIIGTLTAAVLGQETKGKELLD